MRIATSVWWLGVLREIEQLVKLCPVCMKNTTPHTEPLLQPGLHSHPWEKVAADLFQLKGRSYLDYYSKYVEVQTLSSMTSTVVVASLNLSSHVMAYQSLL